MKLALILLLVSAPAVLTDDVYQLPAGEWRWVQFTIRQKAAIVHCSYSAAGGAEIRAELVSRPELELYREHKFHDALAASEPGNSGEFSSLIRDPGQYAVLIENTGAQAASAHVSVTLSFRDTLEPAGKYLSRERRLTVILVSFAAFFAIVTLSARALLRASREP